MSPILGIIASGANVAGTAYESIASATGTGSNKTITFSSIPGTYQHLQIRILGNSSRTGAGDDDAYIRFNSDTGSNYAWHYMYGGFGDSTVYAGAGTSQTYAKYALYCTDQTYSTAYGASIIDIHDYSSTSKNKTIKTMMGVDHNGTAASSMWVVSGLWMSTSAITSIDVTMNGGNWASGSVVSLYGIKG